MRLLLPIVFAVATLAFSQDQAVRSNGFEESRALLATARRGSGGGGGGGQRGGGQRGGGGGGGQRGGHRGGGGGASLVSVGHAALQGSGFSAHSVARIAGGFAGSVSSLLSPK
ncbi:unnamed protein product [Aphanomyces euteiches]